MQLVSDTTADTAQPSVDGLAAIPAGESRELMLPQLVSQVYAESPPHLRAGLLECLLKPMRPLGLVAVTAGAFGGFLHRQNWSRLSVSLDDAVRFSADQVYELARFVDQLRPESFGAVARLLSENPVCMATLSGSLLIMALQQWIPPSRLEGE